MNSSSSSHEDAGDLPGGSNEVFLTGRPGDESIQLSPGRTQRHVFGAAGYTRETRSGDGDTRSVPHHGD